MHMHEMITCHTCSSKTAFSGQVEFVDPFITQQTRTARVRPTASKPNNMLMPGMLVNAESTGALHDRLVIPETARTLDAFSQSWYVAFCLMMDGDRGAIGSAKLKPSEIPISDSRCSAAGKWENSCEKVHPLLQLTNKNPRKGMILDQIPLQLRHHSTNFLTNSSLKYC